ncbi:hypothetical protein GBAR_LOCUS31133 [Geodia barretti]|uniref:Uncharacterized protein n=1 Tax=Geodia barretti TaxID=519541 RepID=A0AA35XMK9_GEOBA|nr:hypothetical protein GBAR_LOCUS31133 [Geodia barretti]
MRATVFLPLVCVLLCAVCQHGTYACPSTWNGSPCQVCRAFAAALIHHTDRGTVTHQNVVSRCNTVLGQTYEGCQFGTRCSTYYTSNFGSMSNDLSNNQNADSAYLCRHVCNGMSMVQLTAEKDANLQQRVGSEKRFFDVLMSEMRSTPRQSECNKCKSVSYTVSVSLVNIDEKLMNTLITSREVTRAAMRLCAV